MATFTAFEMEDAQRVADAHQIGRCQRIAGIAAGTVNSNYFLHTDKGQYFVRLYEQQDVDGVAYEWRLIEHLRSRGVLMPARIAGPAAGVVRVVGRPVAVFSRVPGRDVCQGMVTPVRAGAVGAALGRAHRAGLEFPERRSGRFTMQDVARLLSLARQAGRSELDSHLFRLGALSQELQVAEAVGLPTGVIHGDLFRDNVLWEDGQITALLDWESASDGSLVYDIMVTVLAWCCGASLDWGLASALLAGYRSERDLDPLEWRGLRDAGRTACLRFATTRITDIYLRGESPPGYKDYQRFLMRLDALEAVSASELASRLGQA